MRKTQKAGRGIGMKVENPRAYALCFETLSNELRLKIIDLLYRKPMSVQELAKKLGAERSRVSHSLEMLRKCRYVEVERKGKERVYSLKEPLRKGFRVGERARIFDFLDRHMSENCKACTKLRLKA